MTVPELVRRTASAEETRELGAALAGVLGPGDLVLLGGPLGAGKTTLAQGIADGLRVRGPVTSPTFVLARVHPSTLSAGPPMVHVDAYRLAGWQELEDLDLEAMLDAAVTVVEWGQGVAEGLGPDRLELVLQPVDGDVRTVRVRGRGPRWSDVDLGAALGRAAASTPP